MASLKVLVFSCSMLIVCCRKLQAIPYVQSHVSNKHALSVGFFIDRSGHRILDHGLGALP
jgi:hypothetical protein